MLCIKNFLKKLFHIHRYRTEITKVMQLAVLREGLLEARGFDAEVSLHTCRCGKTYGVVDTVKMGKERVPSWKARQLLGILS